MTVTIRVSHGLQQYVYVLEANLVLHNGVTLPLLSEFLSHSEGDPDNQKQDCEQRAFHRLAARLKGVLSTPADPGTTRWALSQRPDHGMLSRPMAGSL